MKKLIILTFLSIFAFSCTNDDWKGELEDMQTELDKVKGELANQKELIEALQKNATISSVEQGDGSYTIKFSDGQSITLANGKTPLITIGDNGNWYIDGRDTSIKAKAQDGTTPLIEIDKNSNWIINGKDTGIRAKGQDGLNAPRITNIVLIGDRLHFDFSDGSSIKCKIKKPYKGLTMYVIGDSYSTFEDWIPKGNKSFYPIKMEDNNVQYVTQTWWYMLSEETNMTLLKNNSYSGSTICNRGLDGSNSSNISFLKRMKDDFCPNSIIKPNIIIIYGGTNDTWINSPLGNAKYSNWSDEDLKKVSPSICYMFYYLKYWNPGSIIINITNSFLKEPIKKTFKEASEYYGIHNIEIDDISRSKSHPDASGMITIKDKVIQYLMSIL